MPSHLPCLVTCTWLSVMPVQFIQTATRSMHKGAHDLSCLLHVLCCLIACNQKAFDLNLTSQEPCSIDCRAEIHAQRAGVPARVRTHDVTKQVEYIGDVQNLVERLSDLPAGGQVLMGPLTYQRIYSRLEEFRIHSLQKAYEQPARSALLFCLLNPHKP